MAKKSGVAYGYDPPYWDTSNDPVFVPGGGNESSSGDGGIGLHKGDLRVSKPGGKPKITNKPKPIIPVVPIPSSTPVTPYTVPGAPSWWTGNAAGGAMNALLPYLSPEDQQSMATNIYNQNHAAFP